MIKAAEMLPYNRRIPSGYDRFDTDLGSHLESFDHGLPDSDLVNLHWICRSMDFRALGDLSLRHPVVWTQHDMNAFTGGCHYAGSCENFKQACGNCYQLNSKSANDLSHRVLARKAAVLDRIDQARLRIVCPSRWLAEKCGESALFGRFKCDVIPYGLDTELFRPRDRMEARSMLGIAPGDKVLLFVADSLYSRRKGMSELIESLRLVRDSKVLLIIVGDGTIEIPTDLRYLRIRGIHNEGILSMIYNAADVFVCPSQEDNLPNTVIEAISCGTPVAAFACGGIPEIISDGETGFLAKPNDPKSLAESLKVLLNLQGNEVDSIRDAVRRSAVERFSSNIQALRYLEIYREMLTL